MSRFTIAITIVGVVLFGLLSFVLGWECAPVKRIREGPAPMRIPIDGKMVEVPAGSQIEMEFDNQEEAYAVLESLRKAASGTGAGVTQAGTTIKTDWKSEAPESSAGDVESSGGGLKGSFAALGGINATSILAGLGALCLIGGVVVFFLGWKSLGIGLAVGGGVALVTAFMFQTYPWLVAILAVLALGGLGYFWYRAWKTKQLQATLQVVTTGVEKAEPDASAIVKAKVAELAQKLGIYKTVDKEVQAVVKG